MRYIHFIVNPISGKGKNHISIAYLRQQFSSDAFRIEVDYTAHKKHAIELTQKAIAAKPDCIVACGGDGTINEVASQIVNTPIKLGIIPFGSGNGLASNLKIPHDIDKAISIIRDNAAMSIDVGKINSQYFFSNTGTGIDAQIIKHYEHSGTRTLWSYIKSSITASLGFKPVKAIISLNGQVWETVPFILFISNSNEMGYTMSLTPAAKLDDGLLDVVIIPKLSFSQKVLLGWHVLNNRTDRFKKAKRCLVNFLHIEYPEKIFTNVQIDGEYHYFRANKLAVGIIPNGLRVLVASQ